MNTELVPYLNFDGNAAEAMRFYESVFGGELSIQTFKDAFPETPAETADRTMHAMLKTSELSIMASDTHPEHSPAMLVGNNVSLSIIGSDSETLTGYFNKLAEGGMVTMPLEKQFWGDTFGACVDKFGIPWMVNISSSGA